MISIIVPIYKAEPYLVQCLQSIHSQSYKNWECILVDDGSPDKCGNICDSWQKFDSRFISVHQENQGVSIARNNGLHLAKGKYVVFVDSDDWVDKDYLKHLRDTMADESIDLSVGGQVQSENKVLSPSCMNDVIRMCGLYTDIFLENIGFFYGPFSKIYRKSIIDKYGLSFPIDLSLGEDMCFNFSYLAVCGKIKFLPNVDYHYRLQNTGLVNQYRKDLFECLFRIWNFAVQIIYNKGMWTERMKAHFSQRLWGYTYDSIFFKPTKSYKNIKSILARIDKSLLLEFKDNFVCAKWIKYCILHEYALPFYIITHLR